MCKRLRAGAFALALGVIPVVAAADCGQPQAPAARIICAQPSLAALDSEMDAVYAAALKRDPTLAADQSNWLGERNRMAWHDAKASPPHADLAHLYRERIEFLANVDNPGSVRDSPVARALLAAMPALQVGFNGVLANLSRIGVVTTPTPRQFPDVAALLAALPAPPSPRLRAALVRWFTDPMSQKSLVYLPQAHLGGMFTVEGTGFFQYWVTFARKGNATVEIPPPSVLQGISERDGGSTGYLATIAGKPVAITETDAYNRPIADLEWRRWLGGKWGPAMRLRVRFAQTLGTGRHCILPSALTCISATRATSAVQAYLRDPWSLVAPSWFTPMLRTQYARLQRQARQQSLVRERAFSPYGNEARTPGFWFPARIDGQLVAGRIADGHVGSHPQSGWQVELWTHWTQRFALALPDVYVTPQGGRVLAAAPLPPVKQFPMN